MRYELGSVTTLAKKSAINLEPQMADAIDDSLLPDITEFGTHKCNGAHLQLITSQLS